jgi:hypothetical protein
VGGGAGPGVGNGVAGYLRPATELRGERGGTGMGFSWFRGSVVHRFGGGRWAMELPDTRARQRNCRASGTYLCGHRWLGAHRRSRSIESKDELKLAAPHLQSGDRSESEMLVLAPCWHTKRKIFRLKVLTSGLSAYILMSRLLARAGGFSLNERLSKAGPPEVRR